MNSNLSKDIRLYMFLRLLMLYSVLISLVLYQRSFFFDDQIIVKTYFITFFTFLVTTGFIFLYERAKKISYFLVSQILYDVLFTGSLIYFAGPFESVYGYFFIFNIISASVLLGSRAGLITSVISGTLYTILSWMSNELGNSEKTFSLLTSLTSFLVTALLTSQFMEELRKSRLQIRRLEALSEEIVNSLDSGLIGMDFSRVIQKINRTAVEMLNLPEGESFLGKKIQETFPIFSNHSGSEVRELVIQGKRRRILVTEVKLPENHSMLLLRDLTEVLDLEQKIRRHERLASIGGLAAGVAHEIRNPIASISGSAQLLTVVKNSENDRLVKIIIKEVERVDRLITQLLQFSKPSSDQKELIDLKSLCEDIIESFQSRSDFQKADIQLKFSSSLSENCLINGNKDELREVLNNLLVNAIQSYENKKIIEEKKIQIKLKELTDHVELSVEDNGIGVPKSFQERIFDPFYTTKSGGTGLGLSQVYKIVRDHNAHIELESEEEVGTTFRIQFSLERKTNGRAAD